MYLKGKVKIGLKNSIGRGNEYYELRKYIEMLNKKCKQSKKDFTAIFYLKNDGNFKNDYEETFDEIMNEILNDDVDEKNKKTKKFKFTFDVDYAVKTSDRKITEFATFCCHSATISAII